MRETLELLGELIRHGIKGIDTLPYTNSDNQQGFIEGDQGIIT